jgi:hypothetical protein
MRNDSVDQPYGRSKWGRVLVCNRAPAIWPRESALNRFNNQMETTEFADPPGLRQVR